MTLKKGQTFKLGAVEFKWDPANPMVVVKIGKSRSEIKVTELWMMVYTISKEKDQDALMPVAKRHMMQFDRVHTIKATKDVKEGETMEFHCHVDVPLTIVESQLSLGDVRQIQASLAPGGEKVIPIPPAVQQKEEGVE